MQILRGITVTDGIGYGSCIMLPEHNEVEYGMESSEEQCLRLAALRRRVPISSDAGELSGVIARLWQDMLQEMQERAKRREFSSAEEAVRRVSGELSETLSRSEGGYLRSRAFDIKDIGNRMLRDLQPAADPLLLMDGQVLVAERLSVFEAVDAARGGVAAVLVRAFSPLSHAAIVLRGSGIPAAYGFGELNLFPAGSRVLVDGLRSQVILEPDDETVRAAFAARPGEESGQDAVRLRDGTDFQICINCAGTWEPSPNGSEIGLLRTEFFYASLTRLPTEAELTREYTRLARRHSRTTIRLLDAGADKPVPGLPAGEATRGIRLLLCHPEILKTQMRAILRAAACGSVRILIPMATVPEELQAVRSCLQECAADLAASGDVFRADLPVGVMIETPSAAVLADRFAEDADFASIGTNDLTQYVMASARAADTTVSEPAEAVLRLIRFCVRVFQDAGKPLSVCGELASDERWLRELTGLGVRRISVPQGCVERVKENLTRLQDAGGNG